MDDQQPKKAKPRSNALSTPESGLKLKGHRKSWNHVFKSDLQELLKNISYKKDMPKIDKVEHVHHFRTINSQLKTQDYCTGASGHFHEVTWEMRNGEPVVTKVGPPLVYKYARRPSGTKRVIAPIEFFDADADKMIRDTHTHKFEYIHSEELSEQSVRRVQMDTFQQLAKSVGFEDRDGGDAA